MQLNKLSFEIGSLLLSQFHSLEEVNITLKLSKEEIAKLNEYVYKEYAASAIIIDSEGLLEDVAQGKKQIARFLFPFPVQVQIEVVDKDATLTDWVNNHSKQL